MVFLVAGYAGAEAVQSQQSRGRRVSLPAQERGGAKESTGSGSISIGVDLRGSHEPFDCGSSRLAHGNRAEAQASSADIPSTGPAKDCELSSRVASEKWIADRSQIDVPQGERSELFATAPAQFFLKIRPWTPVRTTLA